MAKSKKVEKVRYQEKRPDQYDLLRFTAKVYCLSFGIIAGVLALLIIIFGIVYQ